MFLPHKKNNRTVNTQLSHRNKVKVTEKVKNKSKSSLESWMNYKFGSKDIFL